MASGDATNLVPRTIQTPAVGTASVLVMGSNPSRKSLFVFNPNQSALIGICPQDNTPVLYGLGTLTLQPGQGVTLDNPLFTNGINAISSVAAMQIGIWEYY